MTSSTTDFESSQNYFLWSRSKFKIFFAFLVLISFFAKNRLTLSALKSAPQNPTPIEDSMCERRELSKPCRSQRSTYKCPQCRDSVVCCMNVFSLALFCNIPVGYKHDPCSHAATVCALNYLKPCSWTPEYRWQPLPPKSFPHLPALQCLTRFCASNPINVGKYITVR